MSRHVSDNRRIFACGFAAAMLYLVVAPVVWRTVPVRILYEGDAPVPPYRWVRPPAGLAGTNEPPETGTGAIAIAASTSRPGSITTGDGQALVVFPEGSIEARAGETRVDVRITPLGPSTIAPPPSGLRIDGNAYRIEGVYVPSGRPITLRQPATVIVRYPIHATELLRFSASRWTNLKGHTVSATLQVFAPTDQLGVFAAAASP